MKRSLLFLWGAVRFTNFARAIIAIGTEFNHLGLATADVELAEALVKFTRKIVIFHADGQEVLLIVEAVGPVAGHFASELVIIEVNLFQLAGADLGVALRDGSSQLCAQ
jgi:hypothetical protein